ncbi:hypothetical protein JCM9279_007241 [Rhodotorula babjevae]
MAAAPPAPLPHLPDVPDVRVVQQRRDGPGAVTAPAPYRTGEACRAGFAVYDKELKKYLSQQYGIGFCSTLDSPLAMKNFVLNEVVILIGYLNSADTMSKAWVDKMSAARLPNCSIGVFRKILNMAADRTLESVAGFNALEPQQQDDVRKAMQAAETGQGLHEDYLLDTPNEQNEYLPLPVRRRIRLFIMDPLQKAAALAAATYNDEMEPWNYALNELQAMPRLSKKNRSLDIREEMDEAKAELKSDNSDDPQLKQRAASSDESDGGRRSKPKHKRAKTTGGKSSKDKGKQSTKNKLSSSKGKAAPKPRSSASGTSSRTAAGASGAKKGPVAAKSSATTSTAARKPKRVIAPSSSGSSDSSSDEKVKIDSTSAFLRRSTREILREPTLATTVAPRREIELDSDGDAVWDSAVKGITSTTGVDKGASVAKPSDVLVLGDSDDDESARHVSPSSRFETAGGQAALAHTGSSVGNTVGGGGASGSGLTIEDAAVFAAFHDDNMVE